MFACIWRTEAALYTVKIFDSLFLCLALFHWVTHTALIILSLHCIYEVIFSKTDSGARLTGSHHRCLPAGSKYETGAFLHVYAHALPAPCLVSHKTSCHAIGRAIQPSDISAAENTMLVSWTHIISSTLNCRKHQCIRYCTLRHVVFALQTKLGLTHTSTPEPKEDSGLEATLLLNRGGFVLSIIWLGAACNALLPLTWLAP